MIYFDSAATSLRKPDAVADAVYDAIKNMGNSGRGAHGAALEAGRMVYETRLQLARLFHINDCSRIAFTSNATESLNIAIKGLLHPGDHVITTELEHNSVLRPLYEIQQQGVEISFVKSDSIGRISPDQMKAQILRGTRAVICTHSSNLTGNVPDIAAIGALCRLHNLIFVVDASQTAGVFPIDVEQMGIDILCFTGHKGLLGPQGIGGIYVGDNISLIPLKTGGSGSQTFHKTHPANMPDLLEAGTLNVPGIAGLHAGVSYLLNTGLDAHREAEQALMWQFYNGIKDIAGIRIYGDFTVKERSPIVSFNLGKYDSAAVCDQLAEDYDIYTRGGGHCAPLMHQALGTKEQGAVRFSFSFYNTREEVDFAIQAVKQLAKV
ncbi:MAG: cysteine desulfurase family protein [Lachnospiraceae bacterium]|jgi:cysteine desulfurase family protein|nr:cysteine desulfurase family protein [Lachnospiraceae bacterium]